MCKEEYLLYELYRKLCLYEEIVIYGAGAYGKCFLKQMYHMNLYKKYIFAVTEKSKEEICLGHEVKTIDDAIKDMTSSGVVVIAVGKKLRDELLEELSRRKIKNYLVLEDELLAVLKKQEMILEKQAKVTEFASENLMHNFQRNMQKCPAVSVLVPICNVEKYVAQCIKSLLEQSMYNIEIIALDDGSTDKSAAILDELAGEDERIRVIHKSNSGYGDTMNWGLTLARGEYIVILESDDYAETDMIYSLYSAAVLKNADMVIANYYVDCVDENGQLEKITKSEEIKDVIYWEYASENQRKKIAYSTPGIWRCIYKKAFLEKNNIRFLPTPGASYQDTSFFVKAVMMSQKLICIRDRVMHYRRGHSVASVKDTNKVYTVCEELYEIRRYMEEYEMKSWYGLYGLILFIKYYWNFQRLVEPQKTEFLNFFRRELEEADRNGWNNSEDWPEWKRTQRKQLFGSEEDENR